jgi:hypothetical protein
MLPCTALGKPLLKIGTMLTKAILFHFIQLGCVPIFTPFGDFSPFRLQRVKQNKCSNIQKVGREKNQYFDSFYHFYEGDERNSTLKNGYKTGETNYRAPDPDLNQLFTDERQYWRSGSGNVPTLYGSGS